MMRLGCVSRRFLSSAGKPPTKTYAPSPRPIPLGDPKAQREMEQLIRDEERRAQQRDVHQDAEKEPLQGFEEGRNPVTGEIDGPKGPEPTRYGDWERKGRVYDF